MGIPLDLLGAHFGLTILCTESGVGAAVGGPCLLVGISCILMFPTLGLLKAALTTVICQHCAGIQLINIYLQLPNQSRVRIFGYSRTDSRTGPLLALAFPSTLHILGALRL